LTIPWPLGSECSVEKNNYGASRTNHKNVCEVTERRYGPSIKFKAKEHASWMAHGASAWNKRVWLLYCTAVMDETWSSSDKKTTRAFARLKILEQFTYLVRLSLIEKFNEIDELKDLQIDWEAPMIGRIWEANH
jgi:hypothetical protein